MSLIEKWIKDDLFDLRGFNYIFHSLRKFAYLGFDTCLIANAKYCFIVIVAKDHWDSIGSHVCEIAFAKHD